MDIGVAWWHWLVFGVVLLALELVTTGAMFLLFFGASAIAVGILSALGLAGPLWLQVGLFAALSVVALLTLRRMLRARLSVGATGQIDSLIGETALAVDDIPVGGLGKAQLRGAVWQARNAGDTILPRDKTCTVVRVEGLTLWVLGDL